MLTFLRRTIFHNFGLKIFSLAMATLLWATVTHDRITEVALNSPIEVGGIPDKLEVSSESIPQTQIRLRGPRRLLDGLRPSDVRVHIDLTNVQPGERTFQLNASNVIAPYGVRVLQVVPAEVHLRFDWRKTRVVPVQPRVLGRLASGLSIRDVTADPSEVTISGPAKRVDAVDAATTDPVDATGLISRHAFVTNAYVSDPMVQVLTPQPVRVTVVVGKSVTGGE